MPLDQLGTVARGKSRHRPRDAAHLYGGPYPFIQTGDVKHAGLYLSDFDQTYSEAGLSQSKLWPEGTLCITIAANIADTSILKIEACFPDSIIGFIPDPEKADARFIKYLFDARFKRQYQTFTQGAAQDNLSQGKLLSLDFPAPDLLEQQRIADMLSPYDELIENNRRRIALLEEAAGQLYKEWFVRFRFPGHEHVKIIDGVPEGWERKSISELSSFLARGITPIYDEDATGLIINQKCIRDSKVSLEPARSQSKTVPDNKLVRKFDVLINSTGAGTLGRVAQNLYDHENLTVDSHVTIARPDKNVAPVWFGISLTLKQDFLATLGRGATNQTELSKDDVGAILINVPKGHLLWEFEKQAADCATMVMNLISQNDQLTKARDLLLPKLMSGAITV